MRPMRSSSVRLMLMCSPAYIRGTALGDAAPCGAHVASPLVRVPEPAARGAAIGRGGFGALGDSLSGQELAEAADRA